VAIDYGAQVVVGISTDKAAPPVANTYGLSKALMERVYCAMNGKTDTKFVCVRFGNMPWSTGSVFPIWKRMTENDGIIKSTGADMTRLFTTVDEAVKIVASAIEKIDDVQGKILCRTMKAGLISDFLEVWTKHYGGSWERVAPRSGERDYEHLIGEAECHYTTEIFYDNIKHYLITPNKLSANPLQEIVSSTNAERYAESEILEIIGSIPKDVG
jgi:FlaA1/EpsC-like NDP-sugar epimerase